MNLLFSVVSVKLTEERWSDGRETWAFRGWSSAGLASALFVMRQFMSILYPHMHANRVLLYPARVDFLFAVWYIMAGPRRTRSISNGFVRSKLCRGNSVFLLPALWSTLTLLTQSVILSLDEVLEGSPESCSLRSTPSGAFSILLTLVLVSATLSSEAFELIVLNHSCSWGLTCSRASFPLFLCACQKGHVLFLEPVLTVLRLIYILILDSRNRDWVAAAIPADAFFTTPESCILAYVFTANLPQMVEKQRLPHRQPLQLSCP